MRHMPKKLIKERTAYYLKKTGLDKFSSLYPKELSGGMKQRVSIARAFANDPEILLMDEPFAALDEQNKFILQEELLSIWAETGKTVLFITHSIDEALLLSDRILLMSSQPGKIIREIMLICHDREKLRIYGKILLWPDSLLKSGNICKKKFNGQDEKRNEKERFHGEMDEKRMVDYRYSLLMLIVGACSPKETAKPITEIKALMMK